MSETTGGGTDGVMEWEQQLDGFTGEWTARGQFYTEDVPLNTNSQVHRFRLHNAATGEIAINVRLGFTHRNVDVRPFRITGPLIDEVQTRTDPGWQEDTWYNFEIHHDGSGRYTGRIWTADENRPSDPQAISVGSAPDGSSAHANLQINGARHRAFDMQHSFVGWQSSTGPGAGKTLDASTDTIELTNDVGSTLQFGDRFSKDWSVNGLDVLFHEFFALGTGSGEVVTSFDSACTVESQFSAGSGDAGTEHEATLSFDIGGTVVEVDRRVTLHEETNGFYVEYIVSNEQNQSDGGTTLSDVKLYQYADFDVGFHENDRAHWDEEREFLVTEDSGDPLSRVAGFRALESASGRHIDAYPSHEAVRNQNLNGSTTFPQSDSADPVGVLQLDIGTLETPDSSRFGSSDRVQVAFGVGDSSASALTNSNPAIDVTVNDVQLSQSVDDTRLYDPDQDTILERIPDPPLIDGKSTVPLADVDIDVPQYFEDSLPVTVIRRYGIPSGGVAEGTRTFEVTESELESLASGASWAQEVSVPAFEINETGGFRSLEIDFGGTLYGAINASGTVDSSEVTIEEQDPLRVGFVPVELPQGFRDDHISMSEFSSMVSDTADFLEETYPVAEVHAYQFSDYYTVPYQPTTPMIRPSSVWGDAQAIRNMLFEELPVQDNVTSASATIEGFDATVAVIPSGYFSYYGGDSKCGVHSGRNNAAAFVHESCGEETAAHELGHHFTGGAFYEDAPDHPFAQRDDDGNETDSNDNPITVNNRPVDYDHARHPDSNLVGDSQFDTSTDHPGLVCRELGRSNGALGTVTDDAEPILSYGSSRWVDSTLFNRLVETDLEPHPHEEGPPTTPESQTDAVTGVGSLSDGIAVDAIDRTNAHVMTDEPDGAVSIEVRDGEGTVLEAFRTSEHITATAEGGSTVHDAFLFSVSFPESAVSIQFTHEGTTESINIVTGTLRTAIRSLPNHAFQGPADQRRQTLLNKLDAIENQLEAGAHHGAARKLENDVARNVRRWIHDDYDVSPNQYDKSELLDLVADFRDRVSSLADSGGDNGSGNGNGSAGGNGRGNGNGNSGNGR